MPRTKGSKNKSKEIKVEAIETVEVKVEVSEVKQPKIGRLTTDFGRQDLNQLRNKVNEVLDFIDPL